jgi:hypothetical protein
MRVKVMTNEMTGRVGCGHLVLQGEQYVMTAKAEGSLCADCGRRAMARRLRKELEEVRRLLRER